MPIKARRFMKHLLPSRTTWRGLLAKHLKEIVQLRSRCVLKKPSYFYFIPFRVNFTGVKKKAINLIL